MTTIEKQEKVRVLLQELLSLKLNELEESKVFEEISKLSPDPEWSDYVFHSDVFENNDGTFNYDGFLLKIFSYKAIIL